LTTQSLSTALLLGGCQNPDGSTDWGSTALLGAGIGVAAALVAGAASGPSHPRGYAPYHGRRPTPAMAYGYGRGGYRGW
jgi:hypothetical protein